jgi:caa(3)-type oxidase subunit IV
MAHAIATHHSPEQLKAARKKYMNVFYGLIVLTIIELIIVALPIGKFWITIGVAVFSSAKAVVVGWYYMHLEYETRWLQFVAALPVIAFGYAFVLMADAPKRPASVYTHEPERVFRGEPHHGAGHDADAKSLFKQDLNAIEGETQKIEARSGRGGDLSSEKKE